ncbi:MAG TPA: methylglyoxal synthase [Anaerolineae bacterium]
MEGLFVEHSVFIIHQKKRIALVAHDNMKQDLLEWAEWNKSLLINHELYATGTTGKLLENVLQTPIHKLQSGPLGGDQQVGAMISEGTLDLLIFFWDPLAPQPHDTDVKALLRIAVVWNIPVACDRASADFMISSTCMVGEYKRLVPNYDKYRQRFVQGVGAAVRSEGSASADNSDRLVTVAEDGEQPPDPGALADADATALD